MSRLETTEPGLIEIQDEDILGPADEAAEFENRGIVRPHLAAIYTAMHEFFQLFPQRPVTKNEFFSLGKILVQRAREKPLPFNELIRILQYHTQPKAEVQNYERYFFSKFPAPEGATTSPATASLVPEDNAF